MNRVCEICGVEFAVKPSRVKLGWGRFCSMKCHVEYKKTLTGEKSSRWNGGEVERVCEQCGEKFSCWPYRADSARFCSCACHGQWQSENLVGENAYPWKGGKVELTCEWCNRQFTVYIHRKESARFCSRKCSQSTRVGEANSNWRGGKRPYPPVFNNALKKKIRARDNYTCAICGKPGKAVVHHINYMKDCNEEWNLITLCKSCHGHAGADRADWEGILAPLAKARSLMRAGGPQCLT